MNRQDLEEDSKSKPYQEPELPVMVVKEPEVAYETKSAVSFDEDFNRALATAITGDELRRRMHQRIQAWPWKERLSTLMK
jgi:hypothetical protein